jgi:hypothetical protein
VLSKKLLKYLRAVCVCVCARVRVGESHPLSLYDVEETVDYWTNNARECVLCELLDEVEEIVDH